MRNWVMACVFATAAPAMAGEQLLIGPPAAWVRPVAAPSAAPGDGQITYLLSDEQSRLEPGRIATYQETIWRIERAEGLGSSNIALSWQPGTQTLTVHKLNIRRGKQVFDLLASGKGFSVLRREANLESAMLDGTLTATLQPEDVQVGDIVELASTISSADPTLGKHVELDTGTGYNVAIARNHISVEWPANIDMRIRQTEGLPKLVPARRGDSARIEHMADDARPPVLTSRAPARFRNPRSIEISDFSRWADVAALFAPLYDRIAPIAPGTSLAAEVDRIREATDDPRKRTEAALILVQEKVRYVALLMDSGNLVPADPALTWSRRFGDCKAKSAMLVALLRALDVDAVPVIVDTDGNDGLDERLPMVGYFNHVIVRATIDGKAYWLDGTRTGDRRLDQLTTPDYDWGLPLLPKDAALVRMLPEQLAVPQSESLLSIDASAGTSVPAPVHARMTVRGDDAYELHVSSTSLVADQQEKFLRKFWSERYSFIRIDKVGQTYDADKREIQLTLDGVATMDWSGGIYWLTDIGLGSRSANLERGAGEDRTLPYTVRFPSFSRSTEMVLLPPGVEPVNNEPVDEVAGGTHFTRTFDLSGNRLTVVSTTKTVAREFAAKDAPAAQQAIRALANLDPALRMKTAAFTFDTAPAEQANADAPVSTERDGFTRRGYELLSEMDFEGASAAFETALAHNPANATALAGRGFIMAWNDDFEGAARELNAATVADPEDPYVLRTRGYLAQKQKRYAEALRFYTRVLKIEPDDNITLGWRAEVHHLVGDDAAAIRDSEAATKVNPHWSDMYFMRARIHQKAGRAAKAFAEAEAAVAAAPENSFAHYQAAIIYNEGDRKDAAIKAINRAIELRPSVDALISRSFMRAADDLAARLQDIEAALRFDPSHQRALEEKSLLQNMSGDPKGGAATLAIALRERPDDARLLAIRAELLSQAGDRAEAERGFTAARAKAKTSDDFEVLCWQQALTDIDLPTVLRGCEAIAVNTPDDYLTYRSIGLVQLKLGRTEEAIKSYDRSLRLDPDNASSLFGRAVAWQRKGDAVRAKADRDAALAADPDIVAHAKTNGLVFSDTAP